MVSGSTFPSEQGDELGSMRRSGERLLGRTLGGRWTLETLLGVGGSACVFAASHRNGRRAAVKVAHPEGARNPLFRRRFLSEGYAANRVGHEGAVAILDDGQEADGTVFLVMELLSGKSLAQRLGAEGTLSQSDVMAAGIGILQVLAAAHDRGILHRDIKPSNVFVTDSGSIKVLDFGSARLHRDDGFPTRSGTVLGTPAFMAPELASGQIDDVAACTDIWAVGATLFQLVTGEIVHVARTTNEALVTAATRPARSVLSTGHDVSPALAAVIDRALSFAPADRWPNAKAMCAALQELQGPNAARSAISVSSEGPSTLDEAPAPTQRLKSRWVWASLSVLVIGTLGLTLRVPAVKPEPSAPRKVAAVAALPPRVQQIPSPAPSASAAPESPAATEVVGPDYTPHLTLVSTKRPPAKAHPPEPHRAPSDWPIDDVLDRRH